MPSSVLVDRNSMQLQKDSLMYNRDRFLNLYTLYIVLKLPAESIRIFRGRVIFKFNIANFVIYGEEIRKTRFGTALGQAPLLSETYFFDLLIN